MSTSPLSIHRKEVAALMNDPEKFKEEYNRYIATTGTHNMKLPTVEGLAIYLGCQKDTLYKYAQKHDYIASAIKSVAELQAEQLRADGMYGGKEVNSSMAIFLLKALHGYRDTQTIDITSGGEALNIDISKIIGMNSAPILEAEQAKPKKKKRHYNLTKPRPKRLLYIPQNTEK